MRQLVKSVVEIGATASGLTAALRRLRRDRTAILSFHNVVPDHEAGRGDASLHLPLSRFMQHVERLQRTHRVVGLEAALSEAAVEPRPRSVITFDDAYSGAIRLALPELRRRGLPATVFVAPGLLGEAGVWWDELGEAGRLDLGTRHTAMNTHKGRLHAVRRWAFPGGDAPGLPPTYGIATEDELREACGDGITVGGHAWAHACLPSLEAADLRDDLARTLAWMKMFQGPTTPWLALPYGEGTAEIGRVAAEVGFRGVLEIRGGLAPADYDPGSVPRINVPAGVSPRGLELRTSGVLS